MASMKQGIGALLAAPVLMVSACTGKSGSSSGSSSMETTYDFVPPALNSVRTYSVATVDNSGNTITELEAETATSVNADGSFTLRQEDPNHQSFLVNGMTYSIVTEDISFNPSGQETSYVFANANGAAVTCTFDPHGTGPDFPVSVGQSWNFTYNFACGSNLPVSYTQSGTVADTESVSVPAGTFDALKLQSTLTWTDAKGTTHTQSISNWRDQHTLVSVKELIEITLSGNLPQTGYAVSVTRVLESTP